MDVLRTGLWRLEVWDGARIRPQAHVPESGLILPDFGAKEREPSPLDPGAREVPMRHILRPFPPCSGQYWDNAWPLQILYLDPRVWCLD